jgi:hypothetical protein
MTVPAIYVCNAGDGWMNDYAAFIEWRWQRRIEHSERNLPSYHSVHKTSATELAPPLWGACGGYLSHAIAKYWLNYVMIVNNESEKKAKERVVSYLKVLFQLLYWYVGENYEKIRHSRCSVWDSYPCPPKYRAETFPTETSLSVWPQS